MSRLRAVLYARVSKTAGDQDPESQLHSLRPWAERRGWRVVAECVDRITGDPARRGRNPPGLVDALELLAARKADVLGIFAADRLVRSPTHLLELVAQVQRAGGAVASLQDGRDLDTTDEMSELYLFLQGWRSRWDLKLTRERTRAGLERARAAGKTLGRPALALPDLQRAAELVAAGRGRKGLAEQLGCTPWTARKLLALLAKNGDANSLPIPSEPEAKRDPGE